MTHRVGSVAVRVPTSPYVREAPWGYHLVVEGLFWLRRLRYDIKYSPRTLQFPAR